LGESKRSYEILKFPETSASYYNFMKGEVLRDIKESVARVSDEVFDLEANASIPTLPYELPDGTILQVGTPRFSVPETLFVPSKALGLPPKDDFDGYDFKGIHHMINDAISKVDFDLRRELYQNITVTGGVSLIPGLTDRLAKELEALVHSSFKVRVVAAATPAERQFGSWIGGSILGSLGSFQQMWISKGEYEEHGAKIVQSRCT
jgi:actin-like protein 6A